MKALRLSTETWFILGILLVALGVRFWGVGFGLPYLYHADEPLVVNHALAFGGGDFNPHYFKVPPFISYVIFSLFGLFYAVLRGLGSIHDISQFQDLFLSDPTPFYLLGRIVLGVILGTLTVYGLFRVLRLYFSREQAFLTASLLALNFLHVQNSHYIYFDIPLLFILVLTFSPILAILEQKGKYEYWEFGAFAGLAVATKYNGFFIVIPFLTAHILSRGLKWRTLFDPQLLYAAVTALITYSVLNPYTWLDFKMASSDFLALREIQGVSGPLHHLVYSLSEAVGIPLLVLGLCGVFCSVIRWERAKLPFAAFLLGYYGILTRCSQPHDRYVLVLVPFFLFFAADVLLRLRKVFHMNRWLFGLVLASVLFIPAAKIWMSDRIASREDVRTVANRWVEEHVPAGTKIAMGQPFFLPRLKPVAEQLIEKKAAALRELYAPSKVRRIDWMIEQAKSRSGSRYELYFMVTKDPHEFLFSNPAIPYDVDALRRAGIQYVLFPKVDPGLSRDFYDRLKKEAVLVKRFSPYRDGRRDWPVDPHALTGTPSMWKELVERERNGHIIEIYKISR